MARIPRLEGFGVLGLCGFEGVWVSGLRVLRCKGFEALQVSGMSARVEVMLGITWDPPSWTTRAYNSASCVHPKPNLSLLQGHHPENLKPLHVTLYKLKPEIQPLRPKAYISLHPTPYRRPCRRPTGNRNINDENAHGKHNTDDRKKMILEDRGPEEPVTVSG